MSLSKAEKSDIISSSATHESDKGSCEVQISLLTHRIKNLTEHLREYKKDYSSRLGMLKLVGRRRRLLKYLKRKSYDRFILLSQKLSIRIKD